MNTIWKIIKGILLLIGGFVSIIFLLGFFTQAQADNKNESVGDLVEETEYIDEDDYEESTSEARLDIASDILDVLNEEFKDQGYFDYNENVNSFFLVITDEKMIEMAKLVSTDQNSEYATEWRENVTDVMVNLSSVTSEKIGEPTGFYIGIPWEYDGGATSLVSAKDGKLITEFGSYDVE